MISVANKFDIDRNPSSSAADLSFRMEIPRVSSVPDPKSRVQEEDDDRSPSPESRVSGSDDLSLSVHGFETGDMVWGKVKSHPWWPGHIFNEALASPSVRRTRREDHVLVAFFGDSSYGWFDPSELVPFAPTFLEKSRQTASRSFTKAVEESVDESSRRAALGISCMCRNPYNFRPTRVPGYLAVDVPGYERGGIYSVQQIEKAREEFVPEEGVEFLQMAALAPTSTEPRDLEWMKRIAQLLAFRKARFEEFDETYAQAFGMQLVRPPQDNLENEPEKFAPKVAPLSGPLVIAETLGGGKKRKNYNRKKKDKYLLKRRDEHPISTPTIPLPDAYSQPTRAPFIPPSPPVVIIDNFVLQKKDPESIDGDAGPSDDHRKPKPASSPPTPPFSPVEADKPGTTMPRFEAPVSTLVDRKPPTAEPKEGIDGRKLKKKKKKRAREDVNEEGEAITATEEEKKKKQRLGSMASTLKKLAMGIEDAQSSEEHNTGTMSNAGVQSVPAPQVDLSQLELPQLLDDLSALAMDPFYGVERNAPAVTCQVFLKFRSIVYQKSLVLPLANEGEDQEVRPRKPSNIAPPQKEPKENKKKKKEMKENAPKVKLGSFFKRSSDLPNSGRKRPLSDRQEESSAKRSKKLDLLKSLANEKKAAALVPQAAPRGHKDNNAASTSTDPSVPTANADSATKPERQEPLLPLPPKKESPTNLILKFPPRATLPSVANLKARFARFGPLVVDRCRVIWNTHSCRVQFKYNVDAYEAYNYVSDNNLFGQIQVRYSVKEVELPGSQSEPGRGLLESQPESSTQPRPGNGSGNSLTKSRPSSYLLQQGGPLKSILKKPGEDAGKENQRVKFKLAGEEEPASTTVDVSCPDIPSPLSSSSFVPSSKSTAFLPPPSYLLPKPTTSIRAPRSTDFLPPSALPPPRTSAIVTQPPLLSSPVLPPSHFRAFENRPRVSQHSENRLRRQQVMLYGGNAAGEESKQNRSVDVSHRLLSLMLRCNDIVATLKSLPGFEPYRPL